MTRRTASLALTLALALPAAAQVPADRCLATMQPAAGFQVELFAHEPLLINPTSMDIDHKGRVWVAEAVNYRRVGFKRPILRPEGDRIVVLVDKDGDGKADEAVTFYQGKDLIAPLGVCVIPQADGKALRVLVCQSPDILEFWDRDGDLKADGPPKKFLTGFGGFDHDHGVHGLIVGPDGKLYFTVGDSGVNGLQSADGKGRVWRSNSTDCRAGTVWRCDQDGTNLELIAHNFRNNYEACVNSFGEIWLSDNDDDGNQQTRICFVMPGGNYGYHPRGPGQTHWHEEQPGVVHKVLRTGFGSPTGITFYEGTLFPEKYRGHLLHTDAGPRELRAFLIKPKGAGYELDKEVLLTSTDNWFRPSDVCVAPDGSVFVADWYDPGVGGHGMGDWTRGRIFRLTPKGHTGYKVPEVKLDTPEGVLAALGSPCLATRALAISKLGSMSPPEAMKVLSAGLLGPADVLRARALQHHRVLERALTADTDRAAAADAYGAFLRHVGARPEFRALGFRVLTRVSGGSLGAPKSGKRGGPADLERAWKDYPGSTLREMILGLRDVRPEVAKMYFYVLAKLYDGQDHFYRAALNIALGTDPARRDAILADFDKHFPEWNDRVADLVWELRPKSVLPRLEKLLGDAKLTGPQKARIVDILAASDDPAAGNAMLALLLSDAPQEVKTRAIEQLRLFLPGKWRGLQSGDGLTTAIDKLLAGERTRATGLQLVAAANATNRVDAAAKIAADPAGNSQEVRAEAVRTLGRLRSPKSVEALKAVLAEDVRPGITPLKAEAVNALAALASSQPKDPVGPAALAALQGLIDRSNGLEMQQAALAALAGTRAGTVWLLDRHAKKQLPAELVADAGLLLRNSPHQDLRNRALIAFPAPGKLNPKNLPPVAELVKRTGSAERGKQVWAASLTGAAQCAKCHMVRGVGGQIGPDLSMIGKKGSAENLFDSILDPSKAIADQYLQHQVRTTADLTVTGLLVADTPQAITLRDANGKDTTIPKAEVEGEVRKLKVSIMPEDIVAALTEDELIDLVAYLQTLQTAALTPDSFRVAGPFPAPSMDAALDTQFGPEKGAFDPEAKFKGGAASGGREAPVVGWRTIRPDGKGYFDLAAFHGDAGNNSASYLYAEVESPAEQDAEVLLGTDDGARLWVNGQEVFVTRATRAAAPEQDRAAVKLRKGANTVLLKVANGNNPHGFYFALTSKDEVKAVAGK
jgi:putative membrane-bound dehydrogenase-like protein